MLRYLKLSFDALAGLLILVLILLVQVVKKFVTDIELQKKVFSAIALAWVLWWLIFAILDLKEFRR